jgi:cell wall-associated NlpC family hydrolase
MTGGRSLRILALSCLLLIAPLSASAAAPARDGAAMTLLRRSMLTALTATRAADVLRGIEGSLVFLDSRYGGTVHVEEPESPPASAPPPQPEAATPASTEDGKMPPASAGSNGTAIPPPPPGTGHLTTKAPVLHGADIGGVSATYVSGVVLAPPGVPQRIKGVINAANTIVGRPYLWGGGHGSWYASGYDCSGAVSFALAGGGFLSSPLASGQFESWGAPGPGRWITVYASASHAYAVIAGFRWDTVGDASGSGPRWHRAGVPPAGFVARHPPGY